MKFTMAFGGVTESPLPERLLQMRKRHELTQEQAAALVHGKPRNWRNWESGAIAMPLVAWELLCIKCGEKP